MHDADADEHENSITTTDCPDCGGRLQADLLDDELGHVVSACDDCHCRISEVAE